MPSTPQTYPPLGIKFFVANLISLLVYARTIDAKYAFALFEEVLDPELGELYFRKATESVFTTFQALTSGSPLLIVTNAKKDSGWQALAVGIVFVESQVCARNYHKKKPDGPLSLWPDQRQLNNSRSDWRWKWVFVLGSTRLKFETPFELNFREDGSNRCCVAWKLTEFELRKVAEATKNAIAAQRLACELIHLSGSSVHH